MYDHNVNKPLGIDVDRYGFVYVACRNPHEIIALSQDGKESRVILSADSGVNDPFAINIDRESSLLAFSNGTTDVFSFVDACPIARPRTSPNQ